MKKLLPLLAALAGLFAAHSALAGPPLVSVYATPTTGATVNIYQGDSGAVINPAGTLAALTVNLPTCSATYDGWEVHVFVSQIITSLTVTATAGTVVGAPSTLAAAGGALDAVCYGATATWFVRT